MKHLLLIAAFLLFCSSTYSQKYEIGANGIAGYTIVNIVKVVGSSLTDWNQFSYGGNLIGLYHLSEDLSLGAEAGFHRLYYWEYSYSGYGYGTEYNWGTESTILFGPLLEHRKNGFFTQVGLNGRIFTDGTGFSPAIMFGFGYDIKLAESFSIPIGIRADAIFASGTPFAINLSTGIRIKGK